MNTSAALPLIVDMDGTLIATDVLAEGIIAGVFAKPFSTLLAMLRLWGGRAPFKRRIAELDAADIEAIPVREEVQNWLIAEKASGREIHLVSAADEAMVRRVAQRVGLFESAQGSRDGINLRSRRKAAALKARFPGGFVYAGDSRADLAVWQAAKGIVCVGLDAGLARAVKRLPVPIERSFDVPKAGLSAWIQALAPERWVINLLVFVPLLVSSETRDWQGFLRAGQAFLLVCAMASGTYLLRDLANLGADRRLAHFQQKCSREFRPENAQNQSCRASNPLKSGFDFVDDALGNLRARPMACGSIALHVGANVALALILGSLAVAWLISPCLCVPLTIFLAIAACRFWPVRRGAMADALLLAILLSLRMIIGAMALGLPLLHRQ